LTLFPSYFSQNPFFVNSSLFKPLFLPSVHSFVYISKINQTIHINNYSILQIIFSSVQKKPFIFIFFELEACEIENPNSQIEKEEEEEGFGLWRFQL